MDLTLSSLAASAAAAPTFLVSLIITCILILFVPWKANHKPLDALLNSAEDKKEALTKTWREQKISELTSVGVACAILSSIVTGAIGWPFDASTPAPPWSTKAAWYSSLILGLTAISSAMQQSLTLYRLGCYEDCLPRLRGILGKRHRGVDGSTFWTVRWSQMVVWQVPVMLLNFAILLFVGGVIGMLWDSAVRAVHAGGGLKSDDVKIVVVVGSFTAFAFVSYVFGMLFLYYQTFQNVV
ncbi:hypothetical protein N431DRAFT_433567 [Stipitochalara longipes BDJ]|nr:hypothetical protein N431DRAFT_433567 [Stipitochalara longipes BDJ]